MLVKVSATDHLSHLPCMAPYQYQMLSLSQGTAKDTSVHAKWYNANGHRKDFMTNHNENDQYRPGIEPWSQD